VGRLQEHAGSVRSQEVTIEYPAGDRRSVQDSSKKRGQAPFPTSIPIMALGST
jgi:hypothetical protein